MPNLSSPGSPVAIDVITRRIYINKVELSNEISLAQITVNKSFNKVAYAKVVFLDGSASDRDFSLSNEDLFKPGSEIRIELGYHGVVDTVFEGIIVKHVIKIRQKGGSLLLIDAKDKAIKLTSTRNSVYHINKTDSTVINDLAGDLQKEIEPTSFSHKQLVQFNATDWDFIVVRAEANGMLVWTDNGKLVVKRPSTASTPVLEATYGKNILELEAEMDARKQIQEVSSQSWDYTKQRLEESPKGTAQFSENGNISSSELGEVLGAQVKLNHAGYLKPPQLQDWSDAHAIRNHLAKAVGRVRVEGNAKVKPGTLITLEGVGDRFNGNVFVTGVIHHYDGLWQTDIQFGWREDWFYKKEDVMDKPASGLLPGINGLQIGIVLEVNDTEQGGQYRVKVHIPTITSSNEGIWARVATLDAGANRGVYFRPQTKDEVVLGFLNDDPREAIVLGYLHSKDMKQSPLPEKEGEFQYGFVTKEGVKLVFDDTNKRMTLLVPTSGGGEKKMVLNNDSGAFELVDEYQNTIKMDKEGITIEACSGKKVIIKGTMVEIN
jgi:Rhs element Vgr protein